jgi:flagellar motor switch/type III secretory pathway protein FliN
VSLAQKTEDAWGPLIKVPCRLSLELEIPQVRVADMIRLKPGSILSSQWPANRDLPLRVNGRLLAWVEFEGAGEKMNVRVTEFAWEQKS